MQCELPGGAWTAGQVAREARLHPLTGSVEHELAVQFGRARSWPHFVSGALTAAVARIGDRDCSPELVEALSVADRQYLLLCLSRLLNGDDFWVSARCTGCAAWFDLGLKRSQLPVKRAGAGYPFAEVDCAGRRLRLRVPAGADQHCLLGLPEAEATRVLVQRCVVAVDGDGADADFAAGLSDGDLQRIESAIDEVAADIGTYVRTACTECAAEQVVEVDPYAAEHWHAVALYRDVHTIAGRYHWSEADIFALPRERRHLYLDLIEQERGLHH
jgi:hypothetical protein